MAGIKHVDFHPQGAQLCRGFRPWNPPEPGTGRAQKRPDEESHLRGGESAQIGSFGLVRLG